MEFSRALVPAPMPPPSCPPAGRFTRISGGQVLQSHSVSRTPGLMPQSLDNTKGVTKLRVAECYLDRGVESHRLDHLNSSEQSVSEELGKWVRFSGPSLGKAESRA